MNSNDNPTLEKLLQKLREVEDLKHAAAVLSWDQATYMPNGGAQARSRQIALLEKLAHESFTAGETGAWLDQLQPYADTLPHEHDEAALIRVTQRNYDRATRVPADFVAESSEHISFTFSEWASARPANDFARLRPLLEKTLDFSRRYTEFFPAYAHPADALIAQYDEGSSVAEIRPLFATLKDQLSRLVKQISSCPQVDDRCVYQHFDEQTQWDYGVEIVRQLGYDFNRGRQDKTHHPFMITLSSGDIRITTRLREDRLDDALFSSIHECGHALYEQGIAQRYAATPLGEGTSAAVHESQSRLWENVVGRSRGFWEHQYGSLQSAFPQQLGAVSVDEFYRAINKVQPSLIRTDADEVTYNLHVIIRFALELELLEGTLQIADLPEAWHAAYEESLGIRAPDDVDGVLQDVHWYGGLIGGSFQGYTLGNILALQFYDTACTQYPAIPAEIAVGKYETLRQWMTDQIYTHGSKFTNQELVERVTGGPLSTAPYLAYLKEKFGGIYGF